MARKRKKMTPFARLLIFLLFLAPVAYIGASYAKGEDGLQNIKNLVGLGEKKERGFMKGNGSENEEVIDARQQIENLKRKLRDKDDEIKDLKDQIKELNSNIEG